jgi:hypothetical protein
MAAAVTSCRLSDVAGSHPPSGWNARSLDGVLAVDARRTAGVVRAASICSWLELDRVYDPTQRVSHFTKVTLYPVKGKHKSHNVGAGGKTTTCTSSRC